MENWYPVAFDLLRMNSDWLWSVDASGRLVEWRHCSAPEKNEAPAGGYGSWRSILRDDRLLRDDEAQLLRALKHGKPFRCLRIACVMPHLGVRGWLRVSGVPIFDESGVVCGYRGAAVNITGHMMTNRKLERMDSHTKNLMMVLDASPLSIFIAQIKAGEWRITYANASLSALSGFTHDQLMGKPALFMIDVEADEILAEMIKERVDKRMQTIQRLRLLKEGGESFWGEMTLISGCQEKGACTLIGILRNVEAEMAYQAAELQSSRLQALGELAGGMAHEINNLLQPACLNTEILADEFTPDSPVQDLLKDITSGLEQIRFIVRNTLQFSRKEEGLEASLFDLPTLLADRLTYLRSLMPATVTTTLVIDEAAHGDVSISPNEFTQVLTNLVNNAAHAMHGKGSIVIQLQKVCLDGVREKREKLPLGNYFVLSVTDTGCGMTDAVRARIFEPFFTTKPVGEGTGLGLSVVYGIVSHWGGTINVQSRLNEGTTFTLYVPEGASITQGTDYLQHNQGETHGYIG